MSQYFAIELGSSVIKLASIDMIGLKSFTVHALAKVPNPVGSLNFADMNIANAIGSSIKKLITDNKIREKRVVLSIPETMVFSRVVEMPVMTEAELSSAINWEAEQFIPVPLSEVEIDYSIVYSPPKGASDQKMLVYFVAAPKKNLQPLVDFMINLGYEPIAVENEMVSIARSVSIGGYLGPSLILNIGALASVIGIINNSSLMFSYVLNVGGVAMTRSLAQSLSLPLAQAEEYKKTYGLDPEQLEGKVKSGLAIVFDQIVGEIRKAMEFYGTKQNSNVGRIVLTGGGAYTPHLVPYLSGIFAGVEVIIADPLSVGKIDKGVSVGENRASYVTVLGLAMREI